MDFRFSMLRFRAAQFLDFRLPEAMGKTIFADEFLLCLEILDLSRLGPPVGPVPVES